MNICGIKKFGVPTPAYAAISLGGFGIYYNEINVDYNNPVRIGYFTCRESFHNVVTANHLSSFYYVCHPDKGWQVAKHIFDIENHFSIRNKSFFSNTELNNNVWVSVSPFWTEDIMRYHFFTIQLRCASNYESISNWYDRAYSHNYAKETSSAVKHFLEGNVWFNKSYASKIFQWQENFGWVWLFSGKKGSYSGGYRVINWDDKHLSSLLMDRP